MQKFNHIIIGAGSAGLTAVETLREKSRDQSILLINGEDTLPYKRTKVSKNVYKGYPSRAFAVHDASWYPRNDIELFTGAYVSGIDPSVKCITVNGEIIAYEKLLLATGARPKIPFNPMPDTGWGQLWTEHDGRLLHELMLKYRRFVIIGMGVLGVETAWQLISGGKDVVLAGNSKWPMEHYLDEYSGGMLTDRLQRESVDLCFDTHALGVKSSDSDQMIVETNRGRLTGDFIVITTGSEAESTLAESSGIAVGNGILVDSQLRSSEKDIWAAGDCAEHPGGIITGLWHSAENQGRLAAHSMMGEDVENENPPFRLKCEVFDAFWFSAGPVHFHNDGDRHSEVWDDGKTLWCAFFVDDCLTALSGCGRLGMSKVKAKTAQKLIFDAVSRSEALDRLSAEE